MPAAMFVSPWKFTHAADAAARLVIRNALFALGPLGRGRVDRLSMAWCTYTDPGACPYRDDACGIREPNRDRHLHPVL